MDFSEKTQKNPVLSLGFILIPRGSSWGGAHIDISIGYFVGPTRYFLRNISVGPTNIFVGPAKILGFRRFFFEKFWVRHSLRIDVTKKVGSRKSFDFV